MKKTDIEKIIKQGSIRQKIKLYFTDVAYFNTTGVYTITDDVKNKPLEQRLLEDNTTPITKKQILTDRERDIIYNSVKEPKDIRYWEELRTWNKAFLMFKPYITIYVKNFNYLTAQLSKYGAIRLLHKKYEDAINDILEVVEDKKLRETLVETALKSLLMFDAKRYQEKGFSVFVEIPAEEINGDVCILIRLLNENIKEAKEYIETMKAFLNKQLPLQPYKQFLKDEEDKIKAEIEKCREIIENYILIPLGFLPHPDKDLFKTAKEITAPIIENIKRWEDVEVEVTDEEIEDIKNAGI